MKFKRITDRTGYFSVKGTLVLSYELNDKELVFVDSGGGYRKDLFDWLERHDYSVRAVLVTHLHYDHVANNKRICDKYGTEIYIPKKEARILYDDGYAMGDAGMTGKLLEKFRAYTLSCNLVEFAEDDGSIDIGGEKFSIVPLPGHSPGHVGFVTPDGVFAVGDALLSHTSLETMKIPFEWDLGETLDSMDRVCRVECRHILMSHRAVVDARDAEKLVRVNRAKFEDLLDNAYDCLAGGPLTETELVKQIMARAGVKGGFTGVRYWLYMTARAEIDELVRRGRARSEGAAEGRLITRI